MQHEITKAHSLLDKNGKLIEPGYTKGLLMNYDRTTIKAKELRIKEWDYYLITCDQFAIALTIADNSYMGLDSISIIDFDERWEKTTSPMQFMTKGKKMLPESSEKGSVESGNLEYKISFRRETNERILTFFMTKFNGKTPINGSITLKAPKDESMVICTPWEGNDKAFYYNQKIVAMPATGIVHYGDKTYEFKEGKSFGLLDWGRGVWTYKNTWFWGAAQGEVDGHRLGWNIGYGFGNTIAASENMVFYDGVAHKLSQVKFNIPKKNGKDDFMEPWTFTSDDNRFEMFFTPIIDRASNTNALIIQSDQHQVFGKFTGRVVLDDGTVIKVKDFLGFAEKVYNKW